MTAELIQIAQSIAAKLLGLDEELGDKDWARQHLEAFSTSDSRTGAWTAIDKALFCQRMSDLIEKPFLINQQNSPHCQSVAPLHAMALCYPARFCAFAVGLYESGSGEFGHLDISMASGLVTGNLSQLNDRWGMHLVDLMLTLAMKEYQNNLLTIDDVDDTNAMRPSITTEMEEPIEGSDLFSVTRFDETVAGFQALSKETPSFVLADGSMGLFCSKVTTDDHAALMLPDVVVEGDWVTYQYLSWGDSESRFTESCPASATGWRTRKTRINAFELGLGETYHIVPNRADVIV